MSIYDIKIKRLALLLLPTVLRKPLIASLSQSSVQGINVLYGEFMRWRADKKYRTDHNGQVCYLRAVLNDQFDQIERRIVIDDISEIGSNVIYMREIGQFMTIPNLPSYKIINRRGFGGVGSYDFAVVLPMVMQGKIDENRLRSVVDIYRLAGKRFVIMYQNQNNI